MAETVPYGRKTQKPSPVREVHIVWITAGLGCDGDSVSITAATQPSIEDVLLGAIPGLPKVHLHNPVLAYENGDDFLKYLVPGRGRQARSLRAGGGRFDSQREDQEGRLLGGARNRSQNRPAHHHQRVDRSPGAQGPRGDRRRHLRHLRRHPRHAGQSHRLHGPGRLSRLGLAIEGRPSHRQRSRMPGAAGQLHGDGAVPAVPGGRTGAHDSAGRPSAAPRGCSARPSTKAATAPATTSRAISPTEYGSPKCIVKLGCWGPVVNCNVPKRGWMAGIGGCPNVGGICIGCTMPGFPDKFMPFMDEPPGGKVSTEHGRRLRPRDPRAALHHQHHPEQGTEVAASARRTDHRLSPQDLLNERRGAKSP